MIPEPSQEFYDGEFWRDGVLRQFMSVRIQVIIYPSTISVILFIDGIYMARCELLRVHKP